MANGKIILVTGGTGLLGSHIVKLDGSLIAPPRSEMEVADFASVEQALDCYKPETVLHLAAATKPPEHEKSPEPGLASNIIGTANVALASSRRGIRIVYTSTDYLYVGDGPHKETEAILPPYKFAWSKLGGEAAAALIPRHLILRLSFGPAPFPWEKVYEGQWNSKLYVDEMAPLVLALARTGATGIMNVGGPRMTLEEYARRTRPDITAIPKPEWVPKDTSLDTGLMQSALGIADIKSVLVHGKN